MAGDEGGVRSDPRHRSVPFAVFQRNRTLLVGTFYIVISALAAGRLCGIASPGPAAKSSAAARSVASAATLRGPSTRSRTPCRDTVAVAIGTVTALVLTLTDVRAKAALIFVALLPLMVPRRSPRLPGSSSPAPSKPDPRRPSGSPRHSATRNPLYSRKEGIILLLGVRQYSPSPSSPCAPGCAPCRAS